MYKTLHKKQGSVTVQLRFARSSVTFCAKRDIIRDGEEIHFPNREFELLKYLAMNPNIVFSKEHLFERIWGYDYMSDSATVTVHINRIREKIEEDPKNPKIIETVWGAGYRLNMK